LEQDAFEGKGFQNGVNPTSNDKLPFSFKIRLGVPGTQSFCSESDFGEIQG
jgi:hypothetical protein